MKFIIAGTVYPLRGAFAQLNALLYKYLRKSHSVKVYGFKRQYPAFLFPGKTQIDEGEELVKIESYDKLIVIDSINPFNWVYTGIKIRKENADAVIFRYWMPFFALCFFTVSIIAKSFRNTKIIYICDNVTPHERRFGDRVLNKIAFSAADKFIVHSCSVQRDLESYVKPLRIKYSPHPLYNLYGDPVNKEEAKRFLKEKYKVLFKQNNNILFFGYIRKYKGLDNLLRAMKNINNASLLAAGEFYDNQEDYIKLIRDKDIESKVQIISDFIPNEDVRYFFSACDVVILPYYSGTQSGIIQAAYYYDLPVIVSDTGGLKEYVVEGKTGLIMKNNSPEDIEAAVINYFENNLLEQMKPFIREEKKKYEWDRFTEDIINITKE